VLRSSLIVLALVGCSGQGIEVENPDTGTTTDSSASDTLTDGGPLDAGRIKGPYGAGGCPSPCPEYSPFAGESCTVENLECEYGGQFDPKCNLVGRCLSGKWTVINPSGICPAGPPHATRPAAARIASARSTRAA
jgi:hypothetical protein